MTLDQLNVAAPEHATEALARCCGAAAWVQAMVAARPYADAAALHERSRRAWRALDEAAWREAFGHHPRIGDPDSVRARFGPTAAWAGQEQAGAAEADAGTLRELAEANKAYEARFGYVFIVCATGRSAPEMLAMLQERLGNDAATELAMAAAEQERITRLRLDKLLEEDR